MVKDSTKRNCMNNIIPCDALKISGDNFNINSNKLPVTALYNLLNV